MSEPTENLSDVLASPATPTLAELYRLHQTSAAGALSLIDLLAEALPAKPRQAGAWLAAQFGLNFWDSLELNHRLARFDLWPMARAHAKRAILVQGSDQGSLVAVVTDPFDTDTLVQLEQVAAQRITQVICTVDDLNAYLTQQEASLRAVDSLTQVGHSESEADAKIEVLSLASATDAASPAVQLVNSTLYDALRAGASDVHLETTPTGLAVRYRIDGVLDEVTQVHDRGVAEQTISRLKVLAELDIAERRIPQDGSLKWTPESRQI